MLEKAVMHIWMAAGMPTEKIFFSISQWSRRSFISRWMQASERISVTITRTAETPWERMVA